MDSRESFSPIQNQLVHEAFVKSEDIRQAREIRSYNMKLAKLPLGLILVKKDLISKAEINELLNDPDLRQDIKSYIIHKGWARSEQVDACLNKSQKRGNLLSRLVDEKILSKNRLNEAIQKEMNSYAFCKLAIRLNKISSEDLASALQIQSYNKSVTEILYDRKLVTLTELNHVFRKMYNEPKVGTILKQQDLISDQALEEALCKQRDSSLSLGKILIQKKYISLEQLYFALSIQYNTPFQSLAGFVFNEKQEIELRNIIGHRHAGVNRILPLFLNGNNLTLGVSNPSNIIKMHEIMSAHPQLKMNCLLITEEKFEQLYAVLYGEVINKRPFTNDPAIETIPPDRKFVITAPDSQSWLIHKLFERYRQLNGNSGNGFNESEIHLFTEFITESYHHVSKEFNCTSVSFWFEINKNKTIGIMASPNR